MPESPGATSAIEKSWFEKKPDPGAGTAPSPAATSIEKSWFEKKPDKAAAVNENHQPTPQKDNERDGQMETQKDKDRDGKETQRDQNQPTRENQGAPPAQHQKRVEEKSWFEKNQEVDEEKMLQAFDCYHGFLPREDVGLLLRKEGDYLLRISEIDPPAGSSMPTKREIVLSVRADSWNRNVDMVAGYRTADGTKAKNVLIRKINNKYLVEVSPVFDTVADLISHYTRTYGTVNRTRFILRNPINLQPWEFRHNNVQVGRVLGEGAYGQVCAGKVQLKSGQVIECAIKLTKGTGDMCKAKIKEMMQEARLMRQFPDNKNVVQIYGVAVVEQPLYILIELVRGGALSSYLQKNGAKLAKHEKLKMCLDAALGVEFLHRNQCIHRDLAARNCLYTHDKVVKISDFGLSRLGAQYKLKTAQKLPIKWLAPETIQTFMFTYKTDVYSYGVMVYEVWADGTEPWDGFTNTETKERVLAGQTLMMSPLCPEKLRTFIREKVFVKESFKRVSMADIVRYLENLLTQDLSISDSPSFGYGYQLPQAEVKRSRVDTAVARTTSVMGTVDESGTSTENATDAAARRTSTAVRRNRANATSMMGPPPPDDPRDNTECTKKVLKKGFHSRLRSQYR